MQYYDVYLGNQQGYCLIHKLAEVIAGILKTKHGEINSYNDDK